jgi:indolepyruvate ferredoxin oxidoreductase beta subunit
MSRPSEVTNVIVCGLGGQGVIKASDILADAACRAGFDVKKAEIHGMSQRGGSVSSDVRFGKEVLSPMVPAGEADYLVVVADDQVANVLPLLREGGVLIDSTLLGESAPASGKSLNMALLGALSWSLPIERRHWTEAMEANLDAKWHSANAEAFETGFRLARQRAEAGGQAGRKVE